MRQRLTKTVVEAAQPPQDGRRLYLFDAEVPGFCCIVRMGKERVFRTYALRFTARGLRKWVVIGEHGGPWSQGAHGQVRSLTAELAREQALRFRGAWQAGQDPRTLLAAGRGSEERPARPECPTLAEFLVRYQRDHSEHLAYRSAKEVQGLVRRYILPWKGRARLDAITPGDVAELRTKMKGTPAAYNRTVALLRHVFNMARRWKVLPREHENPCAEAPRLKERRRERFLSSEELARLGPILIEARRAHPYEVAGILALMVSGARPAELLTLRRDQLRLQERHVMIERKQRWKPLYLSPPAIAILASIPEKPGNPYVFAGRGGDHCYGGTGNVWREIRKRAGLEDVRLYDAGRHGYASWAANRGHPMHVVAEMLGHAKGSRVTARYAHLLPKTVHDAGADVGAAILAALGLTEGTLTEES